PTRATFPDATDGELGIAQAVWDDAKQLEGMIAATRKAHEDRAKAEAKAKAERQEAARLERRAELLEPAKAQFLSDGGTEQEWSAIAPEVEADLLRRRAVDKALGLDPDEAERQRLVRRQ